VKRTLCSIAQTTNKHLFAHAIIVALACGLLAPELAFAQSYPNSPVFRNYHPPVQYPVYPSLIHQKNWDDFTLVKKANAGDPVAQQELGLRYLSGRRFTADTVKAAYWLKKAAEQGLPTARYNYGLMLNNGWGVAWDPFMAFTQFLAAARKNIPEAQFVLGLTYAENLVVPRNRTKTYQWLKRAADAGFAPAAEALRDFIREGRVSASDSTTDASPGEPVSPGNRDGADTTRNWTPIFLDFETRTAPPDLDDSTLFLRAMATSNIPSEDSSALVSYFRRGAVADTASIRSLMWAADIGNPDAVLLRGRSYESGVLLARNPTLAAVEYIRAFHLGVPASFNLLAHLINRKGFFEQIKNRALVGDAVSQFILSSLVSLRLYGGLSNEQALNLLESASAAGYVQAIIHAGLNYFTGRLVEKDARKALALWRKAAAMGDPEAKVRTAAAIILGNSRSDNFSTEIAFLRFAASYGSTMAETALAYCYETGKGVRKNLGEAVRRYRLAAMRGSPQAYSALRRLYDQLRPPNKEFRVIHR